MIYLILSIIIAIIRIAGHKSPTFQAVSHIFVGWLIGAGVYQYRATWTDGGEYAMHKIHLAIALSVVEVACFMWQHFGGGA